MLLGREFHRNTIKSSSDDSSIYFSYFLYNIDSEYYSYSCKKQNTKSEHSNGRKEYFHWLVYTCAIPLCVYVWMYVCRLPDKIHRWKSSWSVVSVTADRAEILVWSNNEHCFTGSGQIFSPTKFKAVLLTGVPKWCLCNLKIEEWNSIKGHRRMHPC